MAYIPELTGTVRDIRPLDHHYYKSEIILEDVKSGQFSPSFPPVVSIKFQRPVEDLPFKTGVQVHAYAFQIGRENEYEAEGFKVAGHIEEEGEDMMVQLKDKTIQLTISAQLYPTTPPVEIMPGEKDDSVRKKTAIAQFLTRCDAWKKFGRIDNSLSIAGQPMIYHCIYCGAICDILAEDFLCLPRYVCSCCEQLNKEGWRKDALDALKRAEIAAKIPSAEELDLIAGPPPKEWLEEKGWSDDNNSQGQDQ
jgi:hypothetical protein